MNDKNESVEYRLKKADQLLQTTKNLAALKDWDSAINRLYYAAFQAVSAYLASKDFKASTHAGVSRIFGSELIQSGKLSKETSKQYKALLQKRHYVDYQDFEEATEEEVLKFLPFVENFIQQIKQIIENEKAD